MTEDLNQRVARLEAELAMLKTAFLEAMADPPLTRADKDLMLAELLERLAPVAEDSDGSGQP
ncbi:hypothetical protein KHP62_05660 [Rhodobacteraceae bacterium NNCM2]|nr:hypothetical protein [Coraliihabitans acroporae]